MAKGSRSLDYCQTCTSALLVCCKLQSHEPEVLCSYVYWHFYCHSSSQHCGRHDKTLPISEYVISPSNSRGHIVLIDRGIVLNLQLSFSINGIFGDIKSKEQAADRLWRQAFLSTYKYKSPKKFLKKNLAHVGMVQFMNTLADKVQKQDMPCTQWYAFYNMATPLLLM